ncbi:MAG: hypothetical protein IH991_18490 [Planctomycetes bacterium]|nr:hypothetical protein [Planctomycetota bacterium]
MAKKRSSRSVGKSEPDMDDHIHIVKLRLSPEEVQLVRVAAAVKNLQPGVFAKKIVLAKAQEIVGQYRKD